MLHVSGCLGMPSFLFPSQEKQGAQGANTPNHRESGHFPKCSKYEGFQRRFRLNVRPWKAAGYFYSMCDLLRRWLTSVPLLHKVTMVHRPVPGSLFAAAGAGHHLAPCELGLSQAVHKRREESTQTHRGSLPRSARGKRVRSHRLFKAERRHMGQGLGMMGAGVNTENFSLVALKEKCCRTRLRSNPGA